MLKCKRIQVSLCDSCLNHQKDGFEISSDWEKMSGKKIKKIRFGYAELGEEMSTREMKGEKLSRQLGVSVWQRSLG